MAGPITFAAHFVGSVASRTYIGVFELRRRHCGMSLWFIQLSCVLTYCRVCAFICSIASPRSTPISAPSGALTTGRNSRYPASILKQKHYQWPEIFQML